MKSSVTFPVSPDLERPSAPSGRSVSTAQSLRGVSGLRVEACGGNLPHLIGPPVEASQPGRPAPDRLDIDWWKDPFETNGLLRAVHLAFAEHRPVVLSPDDVWLALAQGFANHVNVHAETLRGRLGRQETQTLLVRRDDFVRGAAENDWPGVFNEFSEQIGASMGDDARRRIVSDFSTTTAVEKVASEIVLMDAVQAYFSYVLRTRCGIPEVTLLGTADDWRSLRERVQRFAEFDAADWVKAVSGVLGHFESAYKGNADPQFWQSFYKTQSLSGGPHVTGAINTFFPYLVCPKSGRSTVANQHALRTDWGTGLSPMDGPHPCNVPRGVSSVPFVWDYHGEKLAMTFLGGFVGTSQDPTSGALRPAIGWGIADSGYAESSLGD